MPEPRRADPRVTEEPPAVIMRDMTAERYFSLAESSQPQNLIDGLLYAAPYPSERHEDVVLAVAEAIDAFARRNGGKVFVNRDCWLGDATVIQPDVAYLTRERANLGGRFIRGAPDLVVEVVSAGTRLFDTEAKFAAYGKSGVREAWFVDLEKETVTVVVGDGSEWRNESTVRFGEAIPSGLVAIGTIGLGPAH